jgi:hypothetical protein
MRKDRSWRWVVVTEGIAVGSRFEWVVNVVDMMAVAVDVSGNAVTER